MRHFVHASWIAAALACGAAPVMADVARCTDARGRVIYTDQTCPPGSQRTGAVPVPESVPPGYRPDDGPRQAQIKSAERASRLQRETVESARPPARPEVNEDAGRGLSVIGGEPRPAPEEQRWGQRSEDRGWVDPWGGYPGGYYPGAGAYPRPRPMPDQRPTLRQCDASGCTDTLGNHYDRRGKLDRYPGPGGKTCRPVGTTTICR